MASEASPPRRLLLALLPLALVLAVCAQDSPYLPPDPSTYWVEQVFDHFNATDTRTYKQRILVYSDYYDKDTGGVEGGGGVVPRKPMFFCPGGEADVTGGYEHNGLMFQFGQEVSAFQLFPEHRFFGQSLPFGPQESFEKGTVDKLTVEQALEDYLANIQWAIDTFGLPQDIPIIAFGGSYPGELASFLRIAHPNVVDGALASSAPVRYHPALPGGTRNGAFYAVITSDFAKQHPQCPDLVRNAIADMHALFGSAGGRQSIEQQLRLCSPLESTPQQLRLLDLWIENAFATLGMENYPYPLGGLPAYPMEAACEVMRSYADQPLVGLGATVGVWYNVTGTLKCFNMSEEYYPCADITGCGGGVDDPDARAWDYLSCTEIVSNVDTNNQTDMFYPAPYDFARLSEYCGAMWGTVPQPLHIPMMFNYSHSSNIIYSNGLLDPWWPGGVLKGHGGIDALQYALGAHHLDLRGSDSSDPKPVVDVRQKERHIITHWLNVLGGQ